LRCIFCKCDSTNSKCVEHIIPESLGNTGDTTLILHQGIVCDKCNNYFSREVEKPFLEHGGIQSLRFEERVLSKKGHIPEVQGILANKNELSAVSVGKFPNPPFSIYVVTADEKINVGEKGKIYIPKFNVNSLLPRGVVLSRFLGKIALEYMALILSKYPDGVEYLVEHRQIDTIREHVRLGKIKNWPCSVRQIYPQGLTIYNELIGKREQIVNEVDILITKNNEFFLVLAIFGVEFVINFGGPEIDGYYIWLAENNNKSPLYVDKSEWLKA
jgi:hypothetical protein